MKPEYELIVPSSHNQSCLGGVKTQAISKSNRWCELTLMKLKCGKLRVDFSKGWWAYPFNVRSMGHMIAFDILRNPFTEEYLIPFAAWQKAASLGLNAV